MELLSEQRLDHSKTQFVRFLRIVFDESEARAVTGMNLWSTVIIHRRGDTRSGHPVYVGSVDGKEIICARTIDHSGREADSERTLKDLSFGVSILEGTVPDGAQSAVSAIKNRLNDLRPYIAHFNETSTTRPVLKLNPLDPLANTPFGGPPTTVGRIAAVTYGMLAISTACIVFSSLLVNSFITAGIAFVVWFCLVQLLKWAFQFPNHRYEAWALLPGMFLVPLLFLAKIVHSAHDSMIISLVCFAVSFPIALIIGYRTARQRSAPPRPQ